MKNPKISIITVCFNSKDHIEEAIKSVIEQTYENKEYIIIDGGSKDGTLDIIKSYSEKIDYYISETDKGISDAFNKGIEVATGNIIGIINSDDKLEEGALQIVANEFDDGVDVIRGKCKIWNDKSGYIFEEVPTIYWPKIPIKMRGAHPSTFVSRKTYEKYGVFDTSLKYTMDTDLFLRWSRKHLKIKFVDRSLAYFRLGGASQSDESARRKELLRILKKNGSNVFEVFVFDIYYRLRLFVKHVICFFGDDTRFLFTKKF